MLANNILALNVCKHGLSNQIPNDKVSPTLFPTQHRFIQNYYYVLKTCFFKEKTKASNTEPYFWNTRF